MCGFAGIIGQIEDRDELVARMCARLAHRGPDDEGYFFDTGCALGHRRLSVIDLSPDAKQPIANEDGTVQSVFNGEIYNFEELRRDLEARGHRFRSRTDSEVLVHLYEEYGDNLLAKLRGMFAFAIWDQKKKRVLLARDHFGQKPLFYHHTKDTLIFASEIKALLAAPIASEINPRAIDFFLGVRFVPSPHTCYQGIRRLPPAHTLTLDSNSEPRTTKYWSLTGVSKQNPTIEEATEETDRLLQLAVREQLVADVPVGVFLSGGIDSSLVVGRAARTAPGVKTFSLGYADSSLSELPYARKVAQRYDVDHREIVLSASAVDLQHLISVYDEPFADPAAIPLMHLAKSARKEVTVVLTGDGGDELFGGYEHHVLAYWLKRTSWSSGPRALASRAALMGSHAFLSRHRRWPFIKSVLETLCHRDWRQALTSLRSQLGVSEKQHLYQPDFWKAVGDHELPADLWSDADPDRAVFLPSGDLVLADRLLLKSDMATMAVGLECRAPLLDLRLAEFAASLPPSLRVVGLQGKRLLRRLLAQDVGPKISRRKKMGFSMPISEWLRNDLYDLAHDTMLAKNAYISRFVRQDAVAKLYQEHMSGEANRHRVLWSLLILELWMRDREPN